MDENNLSSPLKKNASPDTLAELEAKLAEIVQSALVQLADLSDVQDGIKEVSERIAKVTPSTKDGTLPNPGPPDSK